MFLCRSDELEAIYPRLSADLERILVSNVRLPTEVLEEACQVAWAQLALRRAEVTRGRELGWLATTAMREALRLLRASRREVSLDQEETRQHLVAIGAFVPGPESSVEVQARMAAVGELPVRQRRMVLMHGFGYDYEEIAQRTGDSRRTVERQLLRAKRHLREVV
jgi:RNA polymerase sigma factor (sigma-70 family)